ncbi:MAG: metallophosphoesterase [Candidatus Omnitrophica bacterium]|jgi:hypothetical protein|nr:metallophosphoesterase [Candidatus Omnitrophota bacterium]MDD5077386.1 metallophosphoesterase [Candidatus Omnitrophota bacterium]MDD5724816.1 metallophosphoesterase [Candidatus Omnitrophota bacterium]
MSQGENFSKVEFPSAFGSIVRIGVLSDTHIQDSRARLPAAILDAFRKVDLVFHAGDIVSLGVIDELKEACSRVFVVAGNMDQDPVKKKYPSKLLLDISGYRVGLTHGSGPAAGLPESLKVIFKGDGCELIVFGHSHRPFNEVMDGVLFFNPGSAMDAGAAYNSYGLIELKKEKNGFPRESGFLSGVAAKIIRI